MCRKKLIILVIIGPNWLNARDKTGGYRIHKENDWGRFEIEMAIKRGIDLIPVLLHPSILPEATDLPKSLTDLSYRQALTIYPGQDFNHGFEKLANSIKKYLSLDELQRTPSEESVKRNINHKKKSRMVDEALFIFWCDASFHYNVSICYSCDL
ncbi:MAG: hypothetical protein GY797_32170 [Deltaproteobacteria bacterium]|nr:hypothetical protein [Deltaproteobacteria bacterium]